MSKVARRSWLATRVAGLGVVAAGVAVVMVAGAPAGGTTGSVPPAVRTAGQASVHYAVVAGHARLEVLTPTLIRLEYAPDGRFENRPTTVAVDRRPMGAYTTSRRHGVLRIITRALVVRYRLHSGRFTSENLTVRPRHASWTARPKWGADGGRGNLGGWVRALDNDSGPVALHPGLLSRSGWHLLDDSSDPLAVHSTLGFRPRRTPAHYQDGYLFGYGRHYSTALRDLRTLTGPAPLLPRSAFGVWFSRYFAYRASDYRSLLAKFRKHRVPLDTLSVDTDWKRQPSPASNVLAGAVVGKTRAYSWNGWEWNRSLFPHPRRFFAWAHRHGIDVALNIHPSIDSTDPKYDATVKRTGPLPTDNTCTLEQIDPAGQCHVFDLTKARQLSAYFALHAPIQRLGTDEWWLDYCCDATTASAPGLTPDTFLNRQYTEHLHRGGDRWLVLSRVGGSHLGGDAAAGPGPGIYAEHRWAIHFTGDTCATWRMLGFEARLTADEGNLGIPYVSHDIGSFNGVPQRGSCSATSGASHAQVPAALYARWVQFGALQPLERLHSNHGYRLPWNYPKAAKRAAAAALRLRESLVPYLYTVARQAHDTGLPMTRHLYLTWPRRPAAYRHGAEYTLGRDLLVRPVTSSGNPAKVRVWFPPGRWVDWYTGRSFRGPRVRTLSVPLRRMPLFVRAGAVVATQPSVTHTSAGPPQHLVLTVYPGQRGSGQLYDDRGTGFGYQHGAFTWTHFTHRVRGRRDRLRIGGARGGFAGAPRHRSWTVRFVDVPRPTTVVLGNRSVHWQYLGSSRTVVVRVDPVSTRRAVTLTLRR